MSDETGGPAFPAEMLTERFPGMTLLDYFAGQALAGMSANSEMLDNVTQTSTAAIARWSYDIAAAMLAERTKR